MSEERGHIFAVALAQLLNRIHNYMTNILEKGQPFGACLVNPRHSLASKPTKQIQEEIEQIATRYFEDTKAAGYYLRYSTLPLIPIDPKKSSTDAASIDDYQITLEHPQFDKRWQQTVVSRAILYCMAETEAHSWDEWFELQHEAIRLTPLLHQSLNEATLLQWIQHQLHAPVQPIFEKFVYNYALTDQHITISSKDKNKWINKEIPWESLYPLTANILKPKMSLKEGYKLIYKKASSTRNPVLKDLWTTFMQYVENMLFNHSVLPSGIQLQLVEDLRESKKGPPKTVYNAKRAALAVSDIECALVLYKLIDDFVKSKTKKLISAEAIIFIWIAQHSAFSGLSITGKQIRSIKIKDINFHELTIQVSGKEINISTGLKDILNAYTKGVNRNRLLLQNLSYDNLEDILARASSKLFGEEKKLLPKDLLEAVHVISGVRLPIHLREQINKQAELIKNSPYRIKTDDIKKSIKQAINSVTR